MKIKLIFLIISSLFLLQACTHMFFYPQKQLIRTPKDVGINYEDVNFKSRDGMALHGWYLPAEEKAWGTVLFFHGNAENISTHLGAVY